MFMPHIRGEIAVLWVSYSWDNPPWIINCPCKFDFTLGMLIGAVTFLMCENSRRFFHKCIYGWRMESLIFCAFMGNTAPRDRSATWIPENIFAKKVDGQQIFIRFFTQPQGLLLWDDNVSLKVLSKFTQPLSLIFLLIFVQWVLSFMLIWLKSQLCLVQISCNYASILQRMLTHLRGVHIIQSKQYLELHSNLPKCLSSWSFLFLEQAGVELDIEE